MDAEDAGKVADVMATAFGSSALDLEKFGGAMGNVAPVAKEFGFSLEETTALLGVLANNGIEGTDAERAARCHGQRSLRKTEGS